MSIRFCIFATTALALVGAGCNWLGYGANAVAGGSTTPATFVMPKRPTVIIAEKFSNPGETRGDEEPLCRFVAQDLEAHNVAPVVDPGRVYAMMHDDPSRWRGMTIAAAGRAAGGEQVLYINIVSITVDFAQASDLMRGHAEVRVRLVDAQTGATIWPADASDGYPVSAETYLRQTGLNGITEGSIRADLLRNLAARIGPLFYAVKQD